MTTLQSIESHHRSIAEAALASNMPLNQLAETLRDCAGQLEAVARERRVQEREQHAVADALRRQKQDPVADALLCQRHSVSGYDVVSDALSCVSLDWTGKEFGSGDDL
jgi:septal ring factor EnvC (AmiA/AmiB activator)